MRKDGDQGLRMHWREDTQAFDLSWTPRTSPAFGRRGENGAVAKRLRGGEAFGKPSPIFKRDISAPVGRKWISHYLPAKRTAHFEKSYLPRPILQKLSAGISESIPVCRIHICSNNRKRLPLTLLRFCSSPVPDSRSRKIYLSLNGLSDPAAGWAQR